MHRHEIARVAGLPAILLSASALLSHSGAGAAPRESRPATVEPLVDSLLRRMTLAEKLGQLNLLTVDGRPSPAQLEQVRQGQVGGFLNLAGAEATRAVQQVAVTESRLRIPLLLGLDVIHGYRTIFPIPLAEAASFDSAAAESTARAAAREASAAGVNWTFAPMVDIARDARWGRIAEGAGEDRYLGEVFAAARVRGFQGSDLTANDALLATAKHFAAYGAAEAGRDYNTVDVSERTLREVYLPPFRAAVRAGVGSVMSAFNEIAGVPSSASPWLLTDVLRREWGFRGFVVSDYASVDELQRHGIAGTRAGAGNAALEAGVDMDMVSGIYAADLPALVASRRIPIAVVNEAVRRVLRAKVALGLFRDPYRGASPERERAEILSPELRALARRTADESIVLLKNDAATLPIGPDVHAIAVIGPLADDGPDALGPWHSQGRGEDVVTPLTGLRARAPAGIEVLYARGCAILDPDTSGFAEAMAVARRADLVIMVLGEAEGMSGEAASRTSLDLPGAQERLLETVRSTGKPVVLVVMAGRPLAIAWAAEHANAIVEAWFLGVEAGHALADVLFGDVAPSGKLPATIPRSVGQEPMYYDHTNTGRPASPTDHYTSKYMDVPIGPLYAFGHGLSYTTFSYNHLHSAQAAVGPRDTLTAFVDVTNTGTRPGTEVAQLYGHVEVASVTRPVRQLLAAARVSLQPGETRTVSFFVPLERLGFYDQRMRFVLEPGTIRLFAGGSSTGGVEATFVVR
jgi:beta-glucosidase